MTDKMTTLIVDFGGVLTTDLWSSIRACARQNGLPEETLVDLLHEDPDIHSLFASLERGEVSQQFFEERLAAAANISPENLLRRMCAELRPNYVMLNALKALRAESVKVGILSNSWGTGYFSPYEGYDLESRADVVVYSDHENLRKPEREIFELTIERLKADADSTVFVDDVAKNLSPASSMGMSVIHHVETTRTVLELGRLFDLDL